MRCVLYRRVSTDMQAEEGFSLEAQRVRLQAYAESQGWTITGDYCDEGFSAKNTERPQMQRLIKDIKEKRFDVILVYRLDRFVRSVLDLHELLQLMDKHDVKFKSATEVFDTTSATGRLFITLIATLAQWERETIAERVHMGMTKRAQQGLRNGAPAPYGYRMENGMLIIDEEEAKWVQFIFSRYQTVGALTVSKELNAKGIRTKKGEWWSDFSVKYVLRNPIYTGRVRWNFENTSNGRKRSNAEIITEYQQEDFEPIIDETTFDEVQLLISKRKSNAFRSSGFYPFSGIAKCAKCGYSFSGSETAKPNGPYRHYKCRGRINFGICDMPVISEAAIEEEFLKILTLAETEIEVEQTNDINQEEIQKQLQLLNRRKERAEELYIDGDITKTRYQKLLEEIRLEESKFNQLLARSGQTVDIGEIKAMLRNLKNEWSNTPPEVKKQVVQTLFESITIDLVDKAHGPKRAKISIVDYKLL